MRKTTKGTNQRIKKVKIKNRNGKPKSDIKEQKKRKKQLIRNEIQKSKIKY
jgi:hypothetical protein